MRALLHLTIAIFLTVLTQIGGLAWLLSLVFKRRLLAFPALYLAFLISATATAPMAGRAALDCWEDGPLQMQSWFYCVTARNFMAPELLSAVQDAADATDAAYPGTKTLILDAGFPFFDGFPLLPHLSHDDGEKVDLAFYYRDGDIYLPGRTRSPIGYFAFEPGPTNCPEAWSTLRWDLDALQPLWHNYTLDEPRMTFLLKALAEDQRVGKILLEPHLQDQLGVAGPKIRFQGCRAARHDDHIHLQL